MIDKYYIRARLFPTVLTAVPAIVFFNSFVAPSYGEQLEAIYSGLPFLVNIAFSAAIVFLFVLLNRLLAKEIFQKLYFRDDLKMPSTERLLWMNTHYAEPIKLKIRDKIVEKFNIVLLSKEEEREDELKARKLAASAVAQIRILLRESQFLLQHNIEYGFFRNLIGGSVIAFLISSITLIFALIYSHQQLLVIALAFLIVYALPLIFSRPLISTFGKYYANILFEQFLNS